MIDVRDITNEELEGLLYRAVRSGVEALYDDRQINDVEREVTMRIIKSGKGWNVILDQYDREFGNSSDVREGELVAFGCYMAKEAANQAVAIVDEERRSRGRRDPYDDYRRDGYERDSPNRRIGLTNLARDRGVIDTNPADRFKRPSRRQDERGAANASRLSKEREQRLENGDFSDYMERREEIPVDTRFSDARGQLTKYLIIGANAKTEDIPSVVVKPNEKLVDTSGHLYQIPAAKIIVQEKISATNHVRVIYQKPLYSTREALDLFKTLNAPLLTAEQYCHVLIFQRVRRFATPNAGDLVYTDYKTFREHISKVQSVDYLAEVLSPAVDALSTPGKIMIGKVFLERLNRLSEYYLFNPNDPTAYMSISNWKRLKSFLLVPELQNSDSKAQIEQFIKAMREAYKSSYEQGVLETIGNALAQTLAEKNGFVDVKEGNKTLLAGLPDAGVTTENRYLARELLTMPADSQKAMLAEFSRDNLLHLSTQALILTNMNLRGAAPHPKCNYVINPTTEMLSVLRLVLQEINQIDLTVCQLDEQLNLADCARIGIDLGGHLKINRLTKLPK